MLIDKRLPFRFLFDKIKFEFFAITIFSILIAFFDQELALFRVPRTTTTILGTTISLLLAFRTAQAYDRWWEARILWGSIVNDSRNLIRDAQAFLPEDAKQELDKFVRYQIAWLYCLGRKLRGEDFKEYVDKYLNDTEAAKVEAASNEPNAILDLHAQEIKKAYENKQINEFQQIRLIETLSSLCNSMGACERIKNTVFPQTYSTILHSMIYVFAAMLPLSLTDYPFGVEIFVNITISSAFFLVENTAIYIQDPFEGRPTDTAVTAIARNIEINLKQSCGDIEVPEPLKAETFYIM